MKHAYLAASLPRLTFGETPPVTGEAFRFGCLGVLADEELEELDRLLAGRAGEGRTEFARRWAGMDTQLRNALARRRAARRGIEAQGFLRDHAGFSAALEKQVAEACARSHPLERERELDRLRWQTLEDLAQADPFGLAGVLAFGLKLQIAERWARLTEAGGKAKLDALLARTAAGDGAQDRAAS